MIDVGDDGDGTTTHLGTVTWSSEVPSGAPEPANVRRAVGRVRVLLRTRPFRRLWLVLALSSFGDWLGLLAVALFAAGQVSGAAQGLAFGSVIAVRLLPALLLGPVAGVLADRFDRRRTMATVDLIRFGFFASIPTVGLLGASPATTVAWAAIATFLIESAGMIWIPAKEAAVPNLVRPSQLETANQLQMVTTFGVTPVLAAGILAGITALPAGGGGGGPINAALYFNALTFLAAALVVWLRIPEISGRSHHQPTRRTPRRLGQDLLDGVRFIASTPMIRGLVVGMLGAFAGAGVVVGTARFYAAALGGGDATFALLFGTLYLGLTVGVAAGPRLVGNLSRRRWFGLSIVLAGAAVAGLAFAPHLGAAIVGALLVGAGAGMAFLSGITLVGREVADRIRGRVFAFGQAAVRITLLLAISLSSLLVGLGATWHVPGPLPLDLATSRLLLLAAGAGGVTVGLAAVRQMDDRKGVPVLADLWRSLRHRR